MHIGLINTPSLSRRPISRSMAGGLGFDGHDRMLLPPLDLAILAASLRSAGDTVELIDADPLRLDAPGVFVALTNAEWDALIATVSLPTLDQDAMFLSELRQRHPKAMILGKTMVRDHQVLEALLKKSGADLILHGEADLTIDRIVRGQSRSGTAWLESDGTGRADVFRFDAGEPVHDLNQLPVPARDLLPNDRYVYPLLGTPVATLQTSRGCPYPCGYYCPYPLVEGVKWRSQSAERIAAELKDVVERLQIRKIYFRDATFTLNQERIIRLCDLIIAAGWRLEWVCETRVDCLGDDLLRKMRAAGCVGILIGVETGDEEVMQHRDGKKGLTVPKLAHVRHTALELGIRLHFLLIVGLPKETRESIVATYDLIQRCKPDTIGVTIITPYPGTPLYEEGRREGWIDSHHWEDYGGHQAPMHTPNLSREELVAGKRFLEDGFAILQRRQVGGHSRPLEAMAAQHYEELLRWAYRLDEPIRELRQAVNELKRAHGPQRAAPNIKIQSEAEHASIGPENGPGAKTISVVIPTYNRQAILRKTLLAYASQTIAPEEFEVLVVDDGSTDETVAMMNRFKAPFTLRVLTQPHQGANAARNLAIRSARGEVILITGDDMIPEPDLLEAHRTFHRRHPDEQDAMLGFIDWSPEITMTPFMRFLVEPEGGQQFAFHEVRNGQADFRLFYTSNVSLKRSVLAKQSLLFDPDFTYPAYDDIELGYRLARQGLRLHYNPLGTTCHHHAMTPQGFVNRQRKAGHMAVVLARKHPELSATLLDIESIVSRPAGESEVLLHHWLAAVGELEKPELEALRAIRVNGQGFDVQYTKGVLYPVYHALLQAAYATGVREAMNAVPQPSDGFTKKTYVASIIIPVFNKVELTQQCLTHLAEVTQGVEYEVIVVDNASTDGTREFLATLGGDVQIIHNQENVGFAKACNQGARAAHGQYLVFLNNDTIPLQGWLAALVDEVDAHPDVAAVGSKLLYADGTIQHAGVAFSRVFLSPFHVYRLFSADAAVVNRRREFQVVTGACMLVRRERFEAVDGFDEGYRNGFEDVDLCLKIRERGGRIVYQPKSVLYHLESQTPGRKAYERENIQRLLSRWGHRWWLVDEDAICVPDGYVYRSVVDRGSITVRLETLRDPDERIRWERVAAVQRLAQEGNGEGVKALLAHVHEWPDEASVLRWGAYLSEALGAAEAAESLWKRVVNLEEASDARSALARFALERGQLNDAQTHLDVLLTDTPEHGEGWLLRGILYMQRQAYADATSAFEAALRHGGNARRARMASGMAALGQETLDRAWMEFTEVLSVHPDDAEAMHWVLRTGTVLERWAEVFVLLQRFVDRNPGDLSMRFALAGVSLRLGRHDVARVHYDAVRLLDPAHDGLPELIKALDEHDTYVMPHGR